MGTEPQEPAGPQLPVLDALGPSGAYRTHNRQQIQDVTGAPLAELSLAPALFVNRAMKALHGAAPLPAPERAAALARAGELFRTATLGGFSPQEYEQAVTRVSGLPVTVVRTATRTCAERVGQSYRSVQLARPSGAVSDWRDPLARTGQALWTRRGEVLAVHVPGNHPGTHGFWPEALALGYRVAVRPSAREPFTAHRLVLALREAGFGDDQVALLPSGHEAADAILRGADLAYGGDEIIRRYADDPGVLSLRPGRSKILLTADTDWREHLDMIVDSVVRHGGTGCVNATAVLLEGDPAPLAGAVAERLAALPSLPRTTRRRACRSRRPSPHGHWRPMCSNAPGAPGPGSAAPASSTNSVTAVRCCAPRSTNWTRPTPRSSVPKCPSPASGSPPGPGRTASRPCATHSSSPLSPRTRRSSTPWSPNRPSAICTSAGAPRTGTGRDCRTTAISASS